MKTQPYRPPQTSGGLLFAEEVLLTKEGTSARLLPAIALLYVSNFVRVGADFTLSQMDGTVLAESSAGEIRAITEVSVALEGVRRYLDEFSSLLDEEIRKELSSAAATLPSETPASETSPSG